MGRTLGIPGEVGSKEVEVDMMVIWLRRCSQDRTGLAFMQLFVAGLTIGANTIFANVPFELSTKQTLRNGAEILIIRPFSIRNTERAAQACD